MRQLLLWIAVAMGVAACKAPTGGELGRAQFEWERGLGCLIGCDAAAPVATRATVGLHIKNHDALPAFTASSDTPAVIDVTGSSSSDVDLHASSAGMARIILRDAGGADIDRLPVRVK